MITSIPKALKTLLIITSIVIISNLLTGCMSYYKVQTSQLPFNKTDLKTFIKEDKYFILHDVDTAFCLSNTSYNDTSFTGKLSALPKVHLKYKTEKGSYKYDNDGYDKEDQILNEVHLYINDKVKDKFFAGNYTSVIKVNINSKDKDKTNSSSLKGTTAVIMFVFIPLACLIYDFETNFHVF